MTMNFNTDKLKRLFSVDRPPAEALLKRMQKYRELAAWNAEVDAKKAAKRMRRARRKAQRKGDSP